MGASLEDQLRKQAQKLGDDGDGYDGPVSVCPGRKHDDAAKRLAGFYLRLELPNFRFCSWTSPAARNRRSKDIYACQGLYHHPV